MRHASIAIALAFGLGACGPTATDQADREALSVAGIGGDADGWSIAAGDGEVILSHRMGSDDPAFVLTCRQNENVLQVVAENPAGRGVAQSDAIRLRLGESEFLGGPRALEQPRQGEANVLRAEFPLSPELLAAAARADSVELGYAGGDVRAGGGETVLADFAGQCAVLTGLSLPNASQSVSP